MGCYIEEKGLLLGFLIVLGFCVVFLGAFSMVLFVFLALFLELSLGLFLSVFLVFSCGFPQLWFFPSSIGFFLVGFSLG